jgi:hypothetical protein
MELRRAGESQHKERQRELVGRLWAIGRAGLALEQFLDRQEPPGTFLTKYAEETRGLDIPGHRRCIDIVNAFRARKSETAAAFRLWLTRYAPNVHRADAKGIGKVFVRERLGVTPSFPVALVEEPGFLLLFCEPDDYALLNSALCSYSLSPKSHGRYMEPVSLFPDAPVGQSHAVPIVLVKQALIPDQLKDMKQKSERIFLHERQHFIQNQLLGLFAQDEPDPRKEDLIIKDEVLAYIRAGTSGQQFGRYLTEQGYPALFHNRPDKQMIQEVVQTIATTFQQATALHEHRAELVYALTGTPLRKIAARIRSLNEYLTQQGA